MCCHDKRVVLPLIRTQQFKQLSVEYRLHVPTVLISGSLNLLEASGTVQSCTGIALPLSYNNVDKGSLYSR
jgi:hypothetical protein